MTLGSAIVEYVSSTPSPGPPIVACIETTVPDEQAGARIAEALVTARLVACAQLGAPLRSRYRWQGELQDDEELPLTLKTRPALAQRVCDELIALHPYDTPEVLLSTAETTAAYHRWVQDETSG